MLTKVIHVKVLNEEAFEAKIRLTKGKGYLVALFIRMTHVRDLSEHAIQAHGMNADDIYVNRIPANFLCQTIPKLVDE